MHAADSAFSFAQHADEFAFSGQNRVVVGFKRTTIFPHDIKYREADAPCSERIHGNSSSTFSSLGISAGRFGVAGGARSGMTRSMTAFAAGHISSNRARVPMP